MPSYVYGAECTVECTANAISNKEKKKCHLLVVIDF